jgi:Asp-tRNA(Asn)/Glu-tRNA(Gln) amidotransferase A subunit family amidase
MSTDGLPLTFQLVGNRLDEVLLCQLGHAFEGAVGRQRVPWLPPRVVSAVDAKL